MRRKIGAGLAVLAVLAAAVVIWHHALARFAVASAIGLATGYRVQIGEMRLERDHGAFIDARVSRDGEPVLTARRIDIYYHLRDLLPGSTRRFGLVGVTVDRPQLTVVHHRDGTTNIRPPSIAAPAAGGPPVPAVPLRFYVRIRDGAATLVDQHRYYKETRRQRVHRIDAKISVDTAARTHYVVTGAFAGARGAAFRAVGTIDAAKGYAMNRITASAIPVATIANYAIDSTAAKILAGTATNVVAEIYALSDEPGKVLQYHLGASAEFSGVRLYVRGLSEPITGIRGHARIFDGGFTARLLEATVGGMPVRISGGIFNFKNPQFRFGFVGTGRLSRLRRTLAFAADQPLHGRARVAALIEGPLDRPLLIVRLASPHLRFGALPFDGVQGTAALYGGSVSILGAHARYDGIGIAVRGNLALGRRVTSELAVHIAGSSSRVPYLGAVLPGQPVGGEAVLRGTDAAFDARGFVASSARPGTLRGFFDITRNGAGTIGPVVLQVPAGGSFVGAYRIDRPHRTSAFWGSALNLTVDQPQPIAFPGVAIPAFPMARGQVIDAEVAGIGPGTDLVLAGRFIAGGATIAGVPFNNLAAKFAGNANDVGMSLVHADGPWGTFDGQGSFSSTELIARGNYAGRLERLRPFTGDIGARGSISGPVAIAISPAGVVVQARGAQLRGATVRGVPVASVSGTLGIRGNALRLYAARARVAGGEVDAAGSYGPGAGGIGLVSRQIDGSGLRGLGIPLQRGRVSASGIVSAGTRLPDFRGTVVVRGGQAAGYPVSGSARIAVAGDALHLRDAVGSLGTTYARGSGTVGALSSGAPVYALQATVPMGDVRAIAAALRLPTYETEGSFSGTFDLRGRGRQPSLTGALALPVGDVNGMGFVDARARISADPSGVTARAGHVLVGSTATGFYAMLRRHVAALAVQAPSARLSDFNDFFDTGDTLSGRGSAVFSILRTHRRFVTSGKVDVRGFRYRSLPIGDTSALWSSRRTEVTGSLAVGGPQGRLNATGSVQLAPSRSLRGTIEHSRYDVSTSLSDLDLSTWLPAFGFPTIPLTGRVDGNARILGRYPHIGIGGDATLRDGTIGPVPISHAEIAARAAGSRIDVTNLTLDLPALAATGSGSVGLSSSDPLAFTVHVQSDDVRSLVAELTKRTIGVSGHFESTVTIGGTLAAPKFVAAVYGTGANAYGVAIPSVLASVTLRGRDVVIRNAELSFLHGSSSFAGEFPLQMRPFSIGPAGAPLSVDIAAKALDVSAFDPLFGNATALGGTIDGHVGLNGTVANPKVYGALHLAAARYSSALETIPIVATVGDLTFSGDRVTLVRLHAQPGRGTLDATGALSLKGGASNGAIAYDAEIRMSGAQFNLPAYGQGTVDSTLRLVKRPAKTAVLSGNATVRDAIIPFSAFLGGGSNSRSGGPERPLPNLAFDLGVTAGRNVRVRSGGFAAGLDISGEGTVMLGGTLADPTLDGRFESTGGTLTYVDHAFRVQSGSVVFKPQDGVVPNIQAVGVTHVLNPDPSTARNPTGSTDITIDVSGALTNPHVTFSSNPGGYTRDQIVALLLPLGGFVGSIAFTTGGQLAPTGEIAGAPPAGTGAPLPRVFVQRENGTLTVGQEAFNLLNAQFATGLLAPIESALGSGLGLSDVNLTFDYNGDFGINFRRLLARNFYAVYATTIGVPLRQTFGLQYQPNAFTAVQFSMFFQPSAESSFLSPLGTISTNPRVTAGQALGGQSGFTFTFQRLF